MAVYTDGIHLVADTEEELHVFSKKIGLKRSSFRDHHHKYYDLFGNKVNLAIISGAVVKDSRFLVNLRLSADNRKAMSIILG